MAVSGKELDVYVVWASLQRYDFFWEYAQVKLK